MMGSDDLTPVSLSPALKEAATSAAMGASNLAISALATAAANAAKPGRSTTEFHATIAAVVLTAIVAVLQALTATPGPWAVPAALGLVAISAGVSAYSISRGRVKTAAITAAAAAVARSKAPADNPTPAA